jgi:hypothetical protein
MKLSEHIKACQSILDEYGDIECYYAIDEEGNAYNIVAFEPSVYYTEHLGHSLDCILTEDEVMDCREYEGDVEYGYPICIIN